MADLRSEKDIEQLRRIALAQQVQIEQLLKMLQTKYTGEELQQKLALLEELTKKQRQAASE